MATDDTTEISSPCLCGKGRIVVTQSMPDHPWVRESQISYSAEIECLECAETYVVHQDYHRLPSLVRREDVRKRDAAIACRRAAETEVARSPEAQRLILRIVSAIDSQSSMAARHRALQRFHLSYESLGTYRKRPYDGAHAVKTASGGQLADIGSHPDMGGEDAGYFAAAAEKIKALILEEQALELQPVKTNARWMRL